VMLNPSVNKSPAVGEPSALQQCYERFYRKDFDAWIPELIAVINKLSEMRFEDDRNIVPKGLIRTMCPGSQKFPCERRRMMIRVLYIQVRQTIESVIDKYLAVLIDPHLFFACASMTETINVVDREGKRFEYHVAHRDALANAALLQLQLEELRLAYAPQLSSGETLAMFMHGPVGDLEKSPTCLGDLKRFRRGDNTSLRPGLTEEGFTDPVRAAFQPKPGLNYESVRKNNRPRKISLHGHGTAKDAE
jgi:hypothetical protein